MKIIADDKIPFLKGVLEPYADIVYLTGNQINNKVIRNADALLIRTRTKCTEELLEGTNVKFIGTATIGYDHIDTHYCLDRKITWTNAPGCNSISVQQYIAAALMRISSANGFNLKDKTLGIIGVGNVGSKVERFARTLGMKVLRNDPPRARSEGKKYFRSFNGVLSESDIVTVHVPLNIVGEDITYHLFNEESFKKMRRGSWFINTSRGEVTDTAALKKALSTGKLGGAVIDVWENEPDIDTELMWQVFISTPHIAGYSADGKANGTAMIVNSLVRYFDLGLKKWYPEEIPLPDSTYISIDCKDKSEEEIIRQAVLFTYNIDKESSRLRLSPPAFEAQRGDYPVRREFGSYTVHLTGASVKIKDILETIGFNVKTG
jgi:erythronate-4-phosphate dehydrogenase